MNLPNNWEIKSYAEAEALAKDLSAKYGVPVLAYDYGTSVSPRYGVIEAPSIGADSSKSFNGDSYPVGKVERISRDYKIITAGGLRFYRRKLKPVWIQAGGTWCLIGGIHNERNPHI